MPSADSPQNVAARFCATLVDEWVSFGVHHAVIAPGSRSTPMALAVAERNDIELHLFHDERAAAFAALGIGLVGTPAIVLCTSGTAAAHFHGAVIEAHQSAVPMLVCTADRPPELRDVGAPQTIDQTKLYGSVVRWFHDPGVAAIEAQSTWRSLAAHAFAMAVGAWPGPVHLNLPFREPLLGEAGELPPRPPAGRSVVSDVRSVLGDPALDDLATRVRRRRGVIVAGRGCGRPEAVRQLALAAGWPVLADARSGVRHLREIAVAAADHLLRSAAFVEANQPDVVVRLGELPASKVVNQWLTGSGADHIAVSAVPAWFDPDGVVAARIVADPDDLCIRLSSRVEDVDASWLRGWIDAEAAAQARISDVLGQEELSEPLVARVIAGTVPAGSQLVVSSSMPIRDVEWFGIIPDGVTVHSNRGANGIDGVVATSVGIALATGQPTAVLIGDVALLHDSSSLTALKRRDVDLRVVVLDNDGGGIFNFLPQASALADDRFEQLFGTPHGTDLMTLAAAHHIPARTVKQLAELEEAMSAPGPQIIRVETDRRANVELHRRLNDS
jgi:2-succinyl-5-enolpyruvyl-6-hydroxy-3-cyclohexene-1-carboxylate synthase